jgi:uncharacterized membrane protein YfcA
VHIDVAIALAGLGVGFVVGLTGMGGGALMTPVLVLFFGVDPTNAVGTDIVASLVMKPIGGLVHLRRGTVNKRLALWLIMGSVPAAFVSVWALHHFTNPKDINDRVQFAIGVALLLASVGLASKGAFSGRRRTEIPTDQLVVKPVPTVLIGVMGGVMVGLTSVGSGSLMMTALIILYPLLTARQLVGTDLVQAIPLVASAALAHAIFAQDIQLDLTTSLLIGALPGVYLGARFSSKAPDYIIRPILAAILVVSGLKMLKVSSMATGIVFLVLLVVAIGFIMRSRMKEMEVEVEAVEAAEAAEAGQTEARTAAIEIAEPSAMDATDATDARDARAVSPAD